MQPFPLLLFPSSFCILFHTETEYHLGLETKLTDVDNNEVSVANKVDESDDNEDVEDAKGGIDSVYLLANEVHPPEYYLKQIENVTESDLAEDYSEGST